MLGSFEILIILVVFILLFGLGGLTLLKNSRGRDERALNELRQSVLQLERVIARTEAALRDEMARNRAENAESASAAREELSRSFKSLADSLVKNMKEMPALQKSQLESFANQLDEKLIAFQAAMEKEMAGKH